MKMHNYEPNDRTLDAGLEDETLAWLDESYGIDLADDTQQLNSKDLLGMGDFVCDAFDAVVNPNYYDS